MFEWKIETVILFFIIIGNVPQLSSENTTNASTTTRLQILNRLPERAACDWETAGGNRHFSTEFAAGTHTQMLRSLYVCMYVQMRNVHCTYYVRHAKNDTTHNTHERAAHSNQQVNEKFNTEIMGMYRQNIVS